MAISDVCKHEVKEETERAVANGMSFDEAFEWLKDIYENSGTAVKKSTIKSKYYRAKKEVANATQPLTPPPSDEIQENQDSEPSKTETVHGGHREGAGRPTKYEQDTDALFQLKRWWKLASKRDQKTFINWIGTEES
ncbi:MAG: hypothetical protein WC331_10165 [Candidatus Omnitrophota bacterium]|jgi:uncharacterized protein YccT (UPF0319 family)